MTRLENLPESAVRSRIMGTAETAAFFNYSIPHFRRLVKAKKLPQPIQLGARKKGWRLGDCIDCVAASQSRPAE
jgi:predicted DNA-binding transcriptional regulator AlpA